MGSCCGKSRRVNDTPRQMHQVYGDHASSGGYVLETEVDKDMALYQYALFCVTRVVDEYKTCLYPEITMGLGSFREDSQHYFPVCQEVHSDLCWAERAISSHVISKESDAKAKNALTDLSLYFMKQTKKKAARNGDEYNLKKRESSWMSNASEELLLKSSDLEKFYDECLKVIMSDLEKKEIWQMSTLFNNQAFQDYLRKREPETFASMCEDSLLIQVPLHPHGNTRTFRMCDMKEIPSDDEQYPALPSPVVNYYLPS